MGKSPSKLKGFLWPGIQASAVTRLLPYLALVGIMLVIGVGGFAGWTYTNANSFCGTLCHTMPPQYLTYLKSPHARVQCVECHLGRDTFTVQFSRKITHVKLLYALIFNTYHYPIISTEMRPANEACETCHFPQKFADDSLREIKYRLSDEKKTPPKASSC